MEIKTIKECFRFRLLRKISPDKEKSLKSIEKAEKRLEKAKDLLKFNFFEEALMESYMSMFHAARTLLYLDGIQEKSHFAISIYLKEKYGKKIPINIIDFLGIHRIERHDSNYGFEYEPDKQDALRAVKDAETFLTEIEKLLKTWE
jgi:uncharacterized protein (UPF0332 family)